MNLCEDLGEYNSSHQPNHSSKYWTKIWSQEISYTSFNYSNNKFKENLNVFPNKKNWLKKTQYSI